MAAPPIGKKPRWHGRFVIATFRWLSSRKSALATLDCRMPLDMTGTELLQPLAAEQLTNVRACALMSARKCPDTALTARGKAQVVLAPERDKDSTDPRQVAITSARVVCFDSIVTASQLQSVADASEQSARKQG